MIETNDLVAELESPVVLLDPAQQSAANTEDCMEALLSLQQLPMPFWKRTFDVFLAGGLLIVLSPFLVLVAVYIRLVSKGPALFRQKRLGEMGSPFTIYKFRTMHQIDEAEATLEHRKYIASLVDSTEAVGKPGVARKLIPGGAILRGFSIDELPQLLNVVKGEMSMVGPRPDVIDWFEYMPWQIQRLQARPGITGLWQVSGKDQLSFSQMAELDIEYIQRQSFWYDLWICMQTFRVVLSKANS